MVFVFSAPIICDLFLGILENLLIDCPEVNEDLIFDLLIIFKKVYFITGCISVSLPVMLTVQYFNFSDFVLSLLFSLKPSWGMVELVDS